MNSCSSVEVRRCRPLLGTFVEIIATGESEEQAGDAVAKAYAAVARVQALMSFYEPESDVTRLNRLAVDRTIEINPWTYEVLKAAARMHKDSAGIFDISIAGCLQQWGYLPGPRGRAVAKRSIGGQSIALLPDNRVRLLQPVQIDLGGIAKGFAVDKAVEQLEGGGIASGLVNAGGDLRVFGPREFTVHVRHPAAPSRLLPLVRLSNAALATSAAYFSRKKWNGHWVTPLVNPLRTRSRAGSASVSVQAPTCLVADALTKVAVVLGQNSARILRAHSAAGFILKGTGEVLATEGVSLSDPARGTELCHKPFERTHPRIYR